MGGRPAFPAPRLCSRFCEHDLCFPVIELFHPASDTAFGQQTPPPKGFTRVRAPAVNSLLQLVAPGGVGSCPRCYVWTRHSQVFWPLTSRPFEQRGRSPLGPTARPESLGVVSLGCANGPGPRGSGAESCPQSLHTWCSVDVCWLCGRAWGKTGDMRQ